MTDDRLTGVGLVPEDGPIVRAMGGALSVFASLLERHGIADMSETANMLGMYAVVTSETDEAEGLILGCWAGMIGDLAEAQQQAQKPGH